MKESWTLKNKFFVFVSLGESGDFNTFTLEISIARELDTEEATKRNMSVLIRMYKYSNQVSILKYTSSRCIYWW